MKTIRAIMASAALIVAVALLPLAANAETEREAKMRAFMSDYMAMETNSIACNSAIRKDGWASGTAVPECRAFAKEVQGYSVTWKSLRPVSDAEKMNAIDALNADLADYNRVGESIRRFTETVQVEKEKYYSTNPGPPEGGGSETQKVFRHVFRQ